MNAKTEGALWKSLSCLCFAAINGLIFLLSGQIPAAEMAFFQNIFALLFLLPFVWSRPAFYLITQKPLLQAFRICLSCVGLVFWYQGLGKIPMTQAVALGFTGPLITTLGAILFLGEKPSRVRLISILIGITGGILIANARSLSGEPIDAAHSWAILLPLASAACFSCATLLNKQLTRHDSPLTIVVYLTAFMTPLLGGLSWISWVAPSQTALGLMAILGLLAALAHFSLTRSFVCADVTFLLPFGSLRLIATAVIGLVFFGQNLNNWVIGGFGLVMTALYILSFEKRPTP